MELKIGVIGFSAQKFDKSVASVIISVMFDSIETMHPEVKEEDFVCISGLTDLGIPSLAYREATKRGWKTIGMACKKAKEYNCYKVDETVIVGDEWGDESDEFIKSLDILLRIGGGKQSKKEEQMAKERGIPVLSFDLPAEKN